MGTIFPKKALAITSACAKQSYKNRGARRSNNPRYLHIIRLPIEPAPNNKNDGRFNTAPKNAIRNRMRPEEASLLDLLKSSSWKISIEMSAKFIF